LELLISLIHIASSVLLIIFVLLQQGKGADVGATLGGGDSSGLFGPMTENPLRNLTTILALVFMVTSVSLAYKSRFPDISDKPLFFKHESGKSSGALLSGQEGGSAIEDLQKNLGMDDASVESNAVEDASVDDEKTSADTGEEVSDQNSDER
jgi:preprotein translocase subunit SecG